MDPCGTWLERKQTRLSDKSLQRRGDLRQSGVSSDERERARGSALGRNHPEGLRENRGHDQHIHRRERVWCVTVIKSAGEREVGGERHATEV